MPTVRDILTDVDSSPWLIAAVNESLRRDPVEAARDAQVLAAALRERAETALAFPAGLDR